MLQIIPKYEDVTADCTSRHQHQPGLSLYRLAGRPWAGPQTVTSLEYFSIIVISAALT